MGDIEIEVLSRQSVIDLIRPKMAIVVEGSVREIEHRGFDGVSGVLGLLALILPAALPSFFDFLKSIVEKDRDMVVIVNGQEFRVHDIQEFKQVVEVLTENGLVAPNQIPTGEKSP